MASRLCRAGAPQAAAQAAAPPAHKTCHSSERWPEAAAPPERSAYWWWDLRLWRRAAGSWTVAWTTRGSVPNVNLQSQVEAMAEEGGQ